MTDLPAENNGVIKPGIYEHFKGNRYHVFGVVRHSETLEDMVIYQAMYGPQAVWVRPVHMFTEEVEHEGFVLPRFKFIEEA